MIVLTLQEHLEARSLKAAKELAAQAMKALPFFGDIVIFGESEEKVKNESGYPERKFRGKVEIPHHNVCNAIEKGLEEKFYEQILKEETDNLLEAVDKIESIRSEIERG